MGNVEGKSRDVDGCWVERFGAGWWGLGGGRFGGGRVRRGFVKTPEVGGFLGGFVEQADFDRITAASKRNVSEWVVAFLDLDT